MKTLRAITYSRVSTADKGQNPAIQAEELQRFCTARAWTVCHEIIDLGFSGGTAPEQRPGLKQLMSLARARKCDVIVVVKLDRLFRSLKHLVTVLDELQSLGVMFVSVNDQLDLSSASGRLMMQIIGAFSEFERALVRERTLAGLAFARSRGKRLGRPRTRDDQAILALRGQGFSYAGIASKLGVSDGAVYRALKGTSKSVIILTEKSESSCEPRAVNSATSQTNVIEAR